jgi:hypothetical protein
MNGNHGSKETESVRVELKYCEHCGGLWVREGGAGVYCEKCQPKVADLPVSRKKTGRIMLPMRKASVVEDYEADPGGEETLSFEAAGGVA